MDYRSVGQQWKTWQQRTIVVKAADASRAAGQDFLTAIRIQINHDRSQGKFACLVMHRSGTRKPRMVEATGGSYHEDGPACHGDNLEKTIAIHVRQRRTGNSFVASSGKLLRQLRERRDRRQ